MTSLTQTAYYTRKTINWIILAVILYFILRFLLTVAIAVFLAIFPPKGPPPNHIFGKLPAVKFPTQTASPSGQLTFRLETIEGGVPRASDAATVYFMPKSPANLLALNKTQEFAGSLGFDNTPIQETKNIYRFADLTFPLRRLRYDIVSNNFIVRYMYEQDTSVFLNPDFPSASVATANTLEFLETNNLRVADLKGGNTGVTYLKLVGNTLVPVLTPSEGNAIRIDIFRNPIGGMKVVYPDPTQGPVSVIYSGAKEKAKKIVQFAYTFWPVDYQTSGTYALKKGTQAWQELQQGSGYIAAYPKTSTSVVVRNMYLAYYDTYDPQTYLQPIFVFEGDDGFIGYVSAIDPTWIE
jgi:hypothetical protein